MTFLLMWIGKTLGLVPSFGRFCYDDDSALWKSTGRINKFTATRNSLEFRPSVYRERSGFCDSVNGIVRRSGAQCRSDERIHNSQTFHVPSVLEVFGEEHTT